MNKASIAIFRNTSEDTSRITQPVVPDAVFEAVTRVMENKNCEIVKADQQSFIVKYSPNGPFVDVGSGEWLPVYVAKLITWTSGGVKKQEYESYLAQKDQPEIIS